LFDDRWKQEEPGGRIMSGQCPCHEVSGAPLLAVQKGDENHEERLQKPEKT